MKIDEGWTVPQIAAALDVPEGAVDGVKRRYADKGSQGVVRDGVQADHFRKLDQKGKADLITLACGDAPEWHDHWTLSDSAGLADQMVELGLVESHSYETVRLNLRKTSSSRGAISPPEADASPTGGEFVAAPVSSIGQAMEDVLDLYAEPYGADRPWCALTRLSTPPEADRPTSGLRVSPRWHPQHLPVLRTAGQLGQSTHHPPAHHVELCSPDAKARGCGLSRCPSEPRDLGQSQHPPHGLPSRDLSTAATRHIVKRLEFHHCPKHAGWLNPVLRLPKGWRKSSSAY